LKHILIFAIKFTRFLFKNVQTNNNNYNNSTPLFENKPLRYLYFGVCHSGVFITSITIIIIIIIIIITTTGFCQSNTPIFIVLTYYTGNMFRLIIESSSGPYIQIQILGYCDCVMGSHTLTYCG
jgi:hypothetical protein